MSSYKNFTITLVGVGKMGTSLLHRWILSGHSAKKITLVESHPSPNLKKISNKLKVKILKSIFEIKKTSDCVVLAVKPQDMESLLQNISSKNLKNNIKNPLFITIAAGKKISFYEKYLGHKPAVVRVMTNTPVLIGEGMSVLYANKYTGPKQKRLSRYLFSSVGEVLFTSNEDLLDPITAVSGSGPAYLFLLAECMYRAAIKEGIDANMAKKIIAKTLSGSGNLLLKSRINPNLLRKNVTSKGGTTETAINFLLKKDLYNLFGQAISKASAKSKKLSR